MKHPAAAAAIALTLLLGVRAPAQVAQVFVDDSVMALDTLGHIPELLDTGNPAEAVRVLQALLDNEGDRVIATTTDPNLFISVRRRVHDTLLATPNLLASYRRDQSPRAQRLLDEGRHREAERAFFLTTPGLEGTLRVTQEHLEAARFAAAFLCLAQLDSHPDRKATPETAARCARAAQRLAQYLTTPAAQDLARRWRDDAKIKTAPDAAVALPPAAAIVEESAQTGFPAVNLAGISRQPLSTTPLGALADEDEHNLRPSGSTPAAWVMPSLAGEAVYTNDGTEIASWDRATLVPLWRFRPTGAPANEDDPAVPLAQSARNFEELSSVSVHGGVVVAATGYAKPGFRRARDTRVHALDAATGTPLWEVDPSGLARTLVGSIIRGPAVICEEACVVGMARNYGAQKVCSASMVGLDLASGQLLWVRPLCSVGTPPYPAGHRPADIPAADAGVVYRSESSGVLAAIEAQSGRVVWIRRSPMRPDSLYSYPSRLDPCPWLGSAPIIESESVLFIEPGSGDVVRLARDSGKILQRRSGDDLGDPRYLVRVGEYLAAVGTSVIDFVKLSALEQGQVRLSPSFRDTGVTGRAVAAGSLLLLPVTGGAALIDPASPGTHKLIELGRTGNTVVSGGHLIVAGTQALESYQTWESAEPRLLKWIEEKPDDPRPSLTYVEIASRVGRVEGIPRAADRVLAACDIDPTALAGQAARRRLFELLLGLAHDQSQGDPAGVVPAPLMDQVLARLARSADTPTERAQQLLAAGAVREREGRAEPAVVSYQQILADTALQDVALPAGVAESATAHARARLTALLLRHGYAAYEPFSAQADQELTAMGEAPTSADLQALAERFPLARATPGIFLDLAKRHQAAGLAAERIQMLGAALESSRRLARITRQGDPPLTGEAAGSLCQALLAADRAGEASRLLKRLARESPGLALSAGGQSLDATPLAAQIQATLAQQSRRPRLGAAIEHSVQLITGWTPAQPRFTQGTGLATDQLPMNSRLAQEVGLWAPRPEDGRLAPLWTRRFEAEVSRPTFLRVDWGAAFLSWPGQLGPSLERIDPADGSTVWKTPEFRSLLPPDNTPRNNSDDLGRPAVPSTPLEGPVDPDRVLVAMDDATVVLVDTRGRGVGFDLATGRSLWAAPTALMVVADATIVDGSLVLIGSTSLTDTEPHGLVALDARTGHTRTQAANELRPLLTNPRWVRAWRGNAVIGTDAAVLAWNPSTGAVAWTVEGSRAGKRTGESWALDHSIVVMTQESYLWGIGPTGKVSPAMRPGDRMSGTRSRDSDSMTIIAAHGPNTVVCSEKGLCVFSPQAELIGTDARGPDRGSRVFALGQNHALFVDQAPVTDARAHRVATIQLLALPSGRVVDEESITVYDTPHTACVIDGRIIVAAGPVTMVIPTR